MYNTDGLLPKEVYLMFQDTLGPKLPRWGEENMIGFLYSTEPYLLPEN